MKILCTKLLTLSKTKPCLHKPNPHSLLRIWSLTNFPYMLQNYSCKSNKNTNKNKQKLLKFPALKLEETIPKFLTSVQPLLTCEEFEDAKCYTQEFMQGEGADLQKLLEEVAKKEENWLAPRWLKVAYLGYRDPVTVYSSPGMTFPLTKFKNHEEYFMYTAKLIMGLLKFKKMVDDDKMPVVKMGKYELDNSQFGAVYGTCRIPKMDIDDIEYHPNSKHIVVICKNHFYKLPVYNKDDKILNACVLAKQLQNISKCQEDFGPAIGVLSTDKRNNWAKAYAILTECHANCNSIKTIQKSLFTVSLDQNVPFEEANKYIVNGQQLVHGGGSKQNSANRWMDKTIQVIVNPNGMSGFCYEHSPAEGQPIAMMTDYITKILPKDSEFQNGTSDNYECFEKLEFGKPSSCLNDKIKLAEGNVDQLANDMQLYVKHYKGYGKEFLKQQKLSPDSFIQIALQYAFYTLHKYPAAHYESAHLRIFYGGRTETIRSCSNEAIEFAQAMLNPQCSNENQVILLRDAVKSHRNYTTLALQGRGVDRHLLGLKLMAIENKKPLPKFFSSKAFVKSCHFRISTSQVATGNEAFMCYGAPVQDGYGCCYNPRKNDIFLACSCWKQNKETNAEDFAKCISEALDNMQKLLKEPSSNISKFEKK